MVLRFASLWLGLYYGRGGVGFSTFIFIRRQKVRITKYELRSEIEAGGARAYENKRCFAGEEGGMMGCGYGGSVDRGAVQAGAGFLGRRGGAVEFVLDSG